MGNGCRTRWVTLPDSITNELATVPQRRWQLAYDADAGQPRTPEARPSPSTIAHRRRARPRRDCHGAGGVAPGAAAAAVGAVRSAAARSAPASKTPMESLRCLKRRLSDAGTSGLSPGSASMTSLADFGRRARWSASGPERPHGRARRAVALDLAAYRRHGTPEVRPYRGRRASRSQPRGIASRSASDRCRGEHGRRDHSQPPAAVAQPVAPRTPALVMKRRSRSAAFHHR